MKEAATSRAAADASEAEALPLPSTALGGAEGGPCGGAAATPSPVPTVLPASQGL